MKTRTRNTFVAIGAAVALTVAMVVANPLVAGAWPEPEVEVTPSACVGGERTVPAVVTLTNLETGYPLSPGKPQVMAVDPEFTWTPFTPDSLPNTGSSKATMNVYPPADFEGDIKVAWRLIWAGPDGGDQKEGKVWIHVEKCVPLVTTTTSTTSTTSTSTTSTTLPTTTTSTTQPTTTTSTTQPTTTTSTTQPTTTTTAPSTTTTTQPSTTTTTAPSTTTTTRPETTTTTAPSTTTTAPSTTTTVPCEPPATSVPEAPTACLIPPVTIEAPPAVAVPTSPRFTG